MEQAQLFKRLLAITEDEFTSFLDFDDNITKALMKLDLAARTRHIIDAVQLEDMWQQLDEESQAFNLLIAMRLSPKTLWGCMESDVELNCLEWRLVLPKYEDIPVQSKPTCTAEYLAMMKQLEVVDIERYDVEKTCAYLDQVYDFTIHQQEVRWPFTWSTNFMSAQSTDSNWATKKTGPLGPIDRSPN